MALADISPCSKSMTRIGMFNVNRIGFGAMRIVGPGIWGEPDDRQAMIDLLREAVRLGVNFIDTSDAYGPHLSEELIREALFPYKDIVIATKGGFVRGGPGVWIPDASPANLRQACEDSLRRLKIDVIDLYQLHTVDPKVPFTQSFQTLLDLQREGKIKNIGLSNISLNHFAAAMNLGNFVSVQNNYSLLNREHEDVLRACEKHGQAFIPYFPLGGGSGKLNIPELTAIAKKHHGTPRQIMLAWLLSHSPNMLPIPGTSSMVHLKENMMAGNIQLDDEDIITLDNIRPD